MNEVVRVELSRDRQQLEYFKFLGKSPCLVQTISIEQDSYSNAVPHQKTGSSAIISEKAYLLTSEDLHFAVLMDSGILYGTLYLLTQAAFSKTKVFSTIRRIRPSAIFIVQEQVQRNSSVNGTRLNLHNTKAVGNWS